MLMNSSYRPHKYSANNSGGFKIHNRQSGYIIVLTVILLGAILLATLNYLEQSTGNLKMSGYNRDSAEALLLAENSMNILYGKFIHGEDIDDDQNNAPDNGVAVKLNDLATLPLHYMYFISDNNSTLAASSPDILQRIANGEATKGTARTSDKTVNKHRVPVNLKIMRFSDLYTDVARPVLFTMEDNKLIISNLTGNDAIKAINSDTRIGLAWFELISNPAMDGAAQIYIQAAARVRGSINYVQRYVHFLPDKIGRNIGAANESKQS